ncbi:hypothetical protein D9M72_517860 [compost metagenome]
MRAVVDRVGDADRGGQQPFAAGDVEITGNTVVERQHAGEQAGDEEQVHQRRQPTAGITLGKAEEEGGRIGKALQFRHQLVGTGRIHHQPGGEHVEDADNQH